jgi:cell division transport system ATP-binding protein
MGYHLPSGESGSLVSEAPATPYIAYRDVEVRYTDLVRGLSGVTLSISRGDFVFFVGRTGAGKSTMLKLLTREGRQT